MSEVPVEPIDDALKGLRRAVKRQLGVERPPPVDLDPATVARFSDDLPERLFGEERARLSERAAALDPWLQGPFLLGGDLIVGGAWRCDQRWIGLDGKLPPSLEGLRVLDVGSNAGYDPFMFRRRGAAYVMACEPYEFFEQASFLESIYRTGVDLRRIGWQALDSRTHGQFELVHCNGVLYHELHPMRMLRRLREMLADGGTLILGSMLLERAELSEYARFVPLDYYGDPTWWWVPGRLAMRWMLAAAGFVVHEEFGTSPGPPGEFPTLNAYFLATAGEVPEALATTEIDERPSRMRFPDGHYYSPVPDLDELSAEPRRSQIWPACPRETPGIDWRESEQVALCTDVFATRERMSLAKDQTADPREYFAGNDQYPALDAWILEAMLRHLRPARMIEVGSGFSSLITARVNRELLDGRLDFICIEPYPRDFLLEGVPGIGQLRQERIQDTPLEVFEELDARDVLFIDTSHTVKTGGDVPWLFSQVLPRLRPGVVVHVHDVFLPGDYPPPWVTEGWGWNELYLVQSFLAFNAGYRIVFGAQYMIQRHRETILRAFPGYPEHEQRAGAALWIERLP